MPIVQGLFEQTVPPEIAALPALTLLGAFLVLSPWLNPDRPMVRLLWSAITGLLLLRYLSWRVLTTIPAPQLSWEFAYQAAYYVVEVLAVYLFFDLRFNTNQAKNRSAEADRFAGWWKERELAPLIDVLIPTYNEDRRVLERTLIGVQGIDYPRYRVWLLDDGARDWLRDWARELGVGYLRRANNRHYKAGNLNNALAHLSTLPEPPEFIAVLDADFVVKPRFLRRVLALMHDPTTGVVQSPQNFYNPDPFQHAVRDRRAWPEEQRMFFDFSLPIYDNSGWATCCGTSFLIRVSALQAIGGFPVESVSEDALTSLKLRRLGFSTVYLNEPLSVGLNPDGLREYFSQRARWALGQVEIARSAWGPLGEGRGLMARVAFVRSACAWAFFGFFTLFSVVMPTIYWWTGAFAVKANPSAYFFYVGPLWVDGAIMAWMSRGRYLPIASEAMDFITSFAVIPATIVALFTKSEKPFVVTTKNVQRNRVRVHWNIVFWIALLGLPLLGGLAYAVFDPYAVTRDNPWRLISLFFSLQTVLLLVMALSIATELPKYRSEERFECNEHARFTCGAEAQVVRLRDLSVGGACFESQVATPIGTRCMLELRGVGELEATVVRHPLRQLVAVRFDGSSSRVALIQKLYCGDMPTVASWSFWRALRATLSRAFA